ncbi:MAG: TonB-dependent receptor [Chitinophagaceae bacterium]|nr:TonB-dependent receptor [Chitinophagaceae bacterium]
MRYSKKIIFQTMFLFLIGCTSIAQTGSITGKLTDEKGSVLKYANVALLKANDNVFTGGVLTAPDGNFSIKTPQSGAYILRISSIGFTEIKTAVFEVPAITFSKDFGTIILKEEVKKLNDVSVAVLRPTITQKADRMVVGIEGTAMAAGSTAYSVLSKAPGVFIDQDGNIQLNGRTGVTVMIDERLTYLSARDLRNMLESMPAENIKNLEIIPNPSAKYDAEGTSGILNINLKKNTQQGMNGSVNAGYNYNGKQPGYTAGASINYKSGRWNSFLNTDVSRRAGGREATFTRIFNSAQKTTYFDQSAIGNYYVQGPPSFRLGSDYNFNKNHSAGFIINFGSNKSTSEFLTNTYIGNAPKQPSQYIDADNYSTNQFTSYTSNLHYSGKLDTLGTLLSADIDYANIRNKGESYFYNYFTTISTSQTSKDFLYTNTPNGFDIYSAKIDFTLPLKKSNKLDIGAKASHVVSDNDSRFYFNNGSLVPDPQRTNHFYYKENIYAAYLNWSGNLSKKLTAQAGLRAEETQSTGNSFTTGKITERNYLDLFPSVFLQQKVNGNYGINYSYSRRLTRPSYGNLNPFRAYRDPYTYVEGNPYLRPQYTHSFSVTQVFKKLYNVILSYQLTKDVMSEIPILDVATTTTVYTTGNVDHNRSISITGIAPLKISRKWDTQNTILLSHNKFSMASDNGQLNNEQLFFLFQSNHTILLPKDFRLELNLLYRGPAASGLYHMAAMSRVDMGLKKSFFNKKIDVVLNINDAFKGYRFLWTTNINGNVNDFNQYLRWRNAGITLRYNFSKGQKVDTKRRNNTLDELNRAGG